MFHPPLVHIFIESGVELLIDVVGDIGTVRSHCHCQFHDIQLRIEIYLLLGKSLPEAYFETIALRRFFLYFLLVIG